MKWWFDFFLLQSLKIFRAFFEQINRKQVIVAILVCLPVLTLGRVYQIIDNERKFFFFLVNFFEQKCVKIMKSYENILQKIVWMVLGLVALGTLNQNFARIQIINGKYYFETSPFNDSCVIVKNYKNFMMLIRIQISNYLGTTFDVTKNTFC